MSRRSSSSSSSLLLLFLLSVWCGVATAGTVTISPRVQHEQRAAVRSSPHLTFPLDARHQLSSFPARPFHSLSHSSSPSSRFSTLQYDLATANMTGCAAIDFSALVTIGEQGPYRLIVDTGSTTLAVVSSACTSCDDAHPTYSPPAGSETHSDQPVQSTYGDGASWSGHAYTARVAVGDSQSVSMVVATIEANNDFIDASKICAVNDGAPVGLNTSQGIIGFAYPTLAIDGTDSWISKYVTSTGVSNEFTLQMCPTGGNLWIGDYDTAFVGGPFSYIPIIKTNYYAVMLNDISVLTQDSSGNTAINSLGYTSAELGPCQAANNADCTIADSGTTLLQLPTAIYNALVRYIQQDTYYQSIFSGPSDPLGSSGQCVPSSSTMPRLETLQANLPQLSLTFTDIDGNSPVTLTILGVPGYLSIHYDTNDDLYYCSGLGSTGGYSILGSAFMNQFTVRHDLANQQLGFAVTANCGVAAPPLPNYKWTFGDWGGCSVASCGGGVQWRSVDCTDIYGTKHPDISCATSYTAQRPTDSQLCNSAACTTATTSQLASVTPSSSSVQQGETVLISYTYTGSPDFVTLYVTPSGASSMQPSYITRNATGSSGGTGTYSWYVPSSLPVGTYSIGGYTPSQASTPFVGGALTVSSCTTGSCAASMDTCSATICNGRGECDIDESSNTAVCSCVSAYSGDQCDVRGGCTTRCINGATLDVNSCSCSCLSGYTGPLCEQIYANMSATLSLQPSSIANAADTAAFQLAFVTDVSYALGLRPNAVVIQSVGATSDGNHTLVTFQLTSMGSPTTLQTYIDLLTSQQSSTSTLSSGLTTARVTSVDVVSGPPSTDSGSSQSIISKYWPYILAGVLGFLALFFILYCLSGGRCAGCRRDKVDADLTRLGPKGSGSLTKQGKVVAGGTPSRPSRRHERRPTHEPRHSYFQGKPVAV